MVRTFLFWLVWNVPLGRLAPWVLGLALGSRPHKIDDIPNNVYMIKVNDE